jgi:hypothetical protein
MYDGHTLARGGGSPVALHRGTDIHGRPNGLYCQVSEW